MRLKQEGGHCQGRGSCCTFAERVCQQCVCLWVAHQLVPSQQAADAIEGIQLPQLLCQLLICLIGHSATGHAQSRGVRLPATQTGVCLDPYRTEELLQHHTIASLRRDGHVVEVPSVLLHCCCTAAPESLTRCTGCCSSARAGAAADRRRHTMAEKNRRCM